MRAFPSGLWACATAFALWSPSPAAAQIPIGGPGGIGQSRPVYSPYLNLLRRDNSTAMNYYGLVRPQLDFMGSISSLQQGQVNTSVAINDLQAGNLPVTGHAAQFLNTGSYFLTIRGGAGASTGMAGQTRGVQTTSPLTQGTLGGSPGLSTQGYRR
jgi:hypothetical protein